MSSGWDTDTYRIRARAWREEADGLPPGNQRDACLIIAEGYTNLIRLAHSAWLPTEPRRRDKSDRDATWLGMPI